MKKTENSLFDKLKQENNLESYIQEKINIHNSFTTKINILSNRVIDIKESFKNKTIENLQLIKDNLIDSSFSLEYSKSYKIQYTTETLNLEKHLKYEKNVIPILKELKDCNETLSQSKNRQIEKPSFIIFLIYIPVQILFEYLYSLTPGLGIFMSLGRFVGIGLCLYLVIQLISYFRYSKNENEIKYFTNKIKELNRKIEKTKANNV